MFVGVWRGRGGELGLGGGGQVNSLAKTFSPGYCGQEETIYDALP